MGVHAAQKCDVQHPGNPHVVDIAATPSDEALIFLRGMDRPIIVTSTGECSGALCEPWLLVWDALLKWACSIKPARTAS